MIQKNSNKSWRERKLDSEELLELEEALLEHFGDKIGKDESLTMVGHFSKEELFLTFLLKNSDETYYYPLETKISINNNSNELTPTEAKLGLADFITCYLDDFFANDRDCLVPIDWTEYEFKTLKLYARGQIFNKKLDYEANELLKSAGYDQYGEEIKKQ